MIVPRVTGSSVAVSAICLVAHLLNLDNWLPISVAVGFFSMYVLVEQGVLGP